MKHRVRAGEEFCEVCGLDGTDGEPGCQGRLPARKLASAFGTDLSHWDEPVAEPSPRSSGSGSGRGIRLYGMDRTNTSWGRVTAGMREGLQEIGAFAGFVPIGRDIADGEVLKGADSPVAIYVGPPSGVAAMTSYGMHERRYAILAPNSDWLPHKLIEEMTKFATLVAPSTWGAKVIEKYTGVYVPPYLHGVSRGFCQPASVSTKRVPGSDRKRPPRSNQLWFDVLHLASTDRQRKGTRELLQGWRQAVEAGKLGPRPRLDVIVDAPEGTFGVPHETVHFPMRQINAPIEGMRLLMQRYHLVCQPSRAEGFGLTPLEARAAGVPVCATDCTGHADHVINGEPGVVVIHTGPDAPVDDAPLGETSLAPSVDPGEIEAALVECYERWPALHKQATEYAQVVGNDWSWASVTEQWLRKVGVEWT